jgi:flagellar protein FlaG
MAIENINRPSFLPESTGNRPQPIKTSATQGASSANTVDLQQDLIMGGKAAATSSVSPPAQNKVIDEVVNEMNQAMLGVRRELKFSIDEGSGRAVVQVWDSETGDMIRQLPSDEVLAVSRHIQEVLEASQSSPGSDLKAGKAVGVIFQTTA